MSTTILFVIIIFVAVFIQSVGGFGISIFAMPLLKPLLGLQFSRALMSLVSIFASLLIVLKYRTRISIKAVAGLTVAALLGVPLGEVILNITDENLVTSALGILIISYGVFALVGPQLPEISGEWWAYPVGFISGILSGAYNTGGPPLVIYGTAKRWKPEEFKGNLQGHGLIKSIGVIAVHAFHRNYDGAIFQHFLLAIPVVIIASLCGFYLSDRINKELFRKIALVILIVLGISLLLD